ncbi:MAG: hypothetical protein O7D97_02865 [Planctomycetota bacterium]|nr:hypothetical protein [Planctomycetota bacterium]
MRRFPRRLQLVLVPTLWVLLASAPGDRAVEVSIRQLRKAVAPRGDGRHLLLLSSLRQLRDTSLRSFFQQLAQHGEPPLRVHAILGLAEINESGHIDPRLIAQLDSPMARHLVIASALDMELIDSGRINELLRLDDLEPKSRVLLLAELVARGEPVQTHTLTRLAGSQNLATAALAACLAAQMGDDAALSSYRARVDTVRGSDHTRHLLGIFDAIAARKLTAVVDWVVQTVKEPNADPDVVAKGISTVLALDPARGVRLWSRVLGDDPPYDKCVRYAHLLLASESRVPASAYDHLPGGDAVIDLLVRAGKAISSGADPTGALIELVELGHRQTTRRVMNIVEDLDDEQAARVYLHLIDSVEGESRGRDSRAETATIAAARLYRIDSDAVSNQLLRAEDDSLTQQAILMGLLESPSPAAGDAARLVKRIGFGRADSLAMLLIAKHTPSLTADELQELGVIASGGGRVSDMLQMQAAWLYLKHTSTIERALVETFAMAPPP